MKERHEQKKKELEDKKTHRIQRAEERRSVKDKELKEKAKILHVKEKLQKLFNIVQNQNK